MKRNALKENVLSMLVMQGANYIIPLLTVPYLVRMLGPDKFGLIVFAAGFAQCFVVIVDGINLSSVRQIAMNRDNPGRISEIFCSAMAVRILFMFAGLAVMAAIVAATPRFRNDWAIYAVSFLTVPGTIMSPVWFFQGMEAMKLISVVNMSARVLAAVSIFALVREGDYLLAAAIQQSVLLIVGSLSFRMIWRIAPIRVSIPPFRQIKKTVVEGWHIIISTVSTNLSASSYLFVIGLCTNNEVVGYFGAADKLLSAVRGLLNPVSQCIYPRVSALVKESKEKALTFLHKSLLWMGGLALTASLGLFVLAGPIVYLVLGAKFAQAVPIVRILAIIPFFNALSNIYGVQTMLAFGMKEIYSRIIVTAALLNPFLVAVLSTLRGGEGAATALVIVEVSVAITMSYVLRCRGYQLITVQKECSAVQ